MAMAAYIIGMQKIASLASPKKRVVEQGFLEFFQDDGQTGSYRFVGLGSIKRACVYHAVALGRSSPSDVSEVRINPGRTTDHAEVIHADPADRCTQLAFGGHVGILDRLAALSFAPNHLTCRLKCTESASKIG